MHHAADLTRHLASRAGLDRLIQPVRGGAVLNELVGARALLLIATPLGLLGAVVGEAGLFGRGAGLLKAAGWRGRHFGIVQIDDSL